MEVNAQSTPITASAAGICPVCHQAVPAGAYFCPNCGHPLRAQPPSVSTGRQIIVYLISFFLPPLGLWYAWKYLAVNDRKSKIVGIAAILLTIISLAAAVWLWQAFVVYVNQSLNQLNGLGF
ncbi:MAG: zinc ribbon domain-containing protein [Patescibacteria group bacterium]|nr:zinc ribbon domain-containing protein [Patescibacteria group bacterium]